MKYNPSIETVRELEIEHIEAIEILNTNRTTGEGIKKTLAFDTPLSREEFSEWRDAFWLDCETGELHIWSVLKQCADSDDLSLVVNLLETHEITLKRKSLTMSTDTRGNVYKLPISIIN